MKTALVALALAGLAACSPAYAVTCANPQELRASVSVDPAPYYSNLGVSFNYQTPYGGQGVLNFPQTVPAGEEWHIYDMYFQDKFRPGAQPSMAILNGTFTLTSTAPRAHFEIPIRLPPGTVIGGQFVNALGQWQIMIFGIHVCRVPVTP